MNFAGQQKVETSIKRGSPTWAAVAAGAILVALLSAAIALIAFATLAPQIGRSDGFTAVSLGPTNAGLVEFRRGERGIETVVIDASTSALEEFRRGEQGGSSGVAPVSRGPDPALVEFRRGERDD